MKKIITFIVLINLMLLNAQAPYFRGVNPDFFISLDNRKTTLNDEGFFIETVNSTHNQPIALAFHPDGDKMVVAERAGKFWLYNEQDGEFIKNNTPVKDISNKVTKHFERGVQDVVLNSHYIITGYTVEESVLFPELNLPVSDNSATIGRISRFEVSWSQNIALSEDILIGTTPSDGIPSLQGNHASLSLALATDGSGHLYVGTGDSSNAQYGQQAIERGIIPEGYDALDGRYRSQVLSQPNGKVLRVLAWNGDSVVGNPYYMPNDKRNHKSRLFDYGYRNPFRIDLASSNDLFIADVGAGSKEEITIAKNNGNAGWGKYEGFDEYSFNCCTINPDTNESFVVDYTNPPVLDYGHSGSALTRVQGSDGNPVIDQANPIEGNSITGGIVLKEGFGDYAGWYFFGDYTTGEINALSPDRTYTKNFAPAGTFNSVVDIEQAPDGSLYVVKLFGGIDRIYYEETLNVQQPNVTKFKMFPNPANDILNILGKNLTKIQITDLQGRTLYKINQPSINNILEINLASGVYFVKVNEEVKKLIVN